jgi:16S rRNA (cytosine967-C5)-methyltransferase
LETIWENEGVKFLKKTYTWAETGLIYELLSHPPLAQLPSFKEGRFYIQDPSTLLAVEFLQPKSGETMLDLCAAPGGKLSYIAQLMQNNGHLTAMELDQDRLDLLKENYLRLGITCVRPQLSNLGRNETREAYDRILIDAPCSNTGVMRRRVDLRWRVSLKELNRLAQNQAELLEFGARVLKPGGLLVYSTCSLEPEENEQVVEKFLQNHSEFSLAGSKRLLPFRDQVDGAYVAKLVKSRQD